MALDGSGRANLVSELREKLGGGRIARIAQTESDELILTVKNKRGQVR
ncbi:MAG: NFACT family protein, partial [Lachnospiraceae bacterium]|nr:NFACT family protein [Lachnospiraceae bacterium]